MVLYAFGSMTELEIRRLTFPRDFAEAWFKLLPSHKTYEEAYEALEDIYLAHFGQRRYSDYNSFRQVKNRLFKTK